MWSSSLVPKTGQIIKKSSTYQMVIKKSVALGCIGKMHIVALKVPFHKAHERGCRYPESINRSTVKARFRRPNSGHCVRMGSIKAWERLTMNMARLALLYTGVWLTVMKSSKPQYCLASRKLHSIWKRK